MPIYEYLCDSCSYQFEVKQSIKDDALTTCERCGKALRRLISSPGIMFKGSGWYVTDYAGKSGAKTDGAGKSEKASGGESTDKSGDASKSKSEAAPAPKKDGGST